MFLSIVHQLNPVELNSKQHDLSATHLRAETTQFISKNISLFQHELKDRVFENFENQKVPNMAEECQQFVDNTLSKEGVWGGIETLVAVQMLRKVNILIINESGDYYLIGEYKDSYGIILLAYRYAAARATSGTEVQRNHYESIACIEPDDVFTIADTLTTRINRKEINQSLKADQLETVVID